MVIFENMKNMPLESVLAITEFSFFSCYKSAQCIGKPVMLSVLSPCYVRGGYMSMYIWIQTWHNEVLECIFRYPSRCVVCISCISPPPPTWRHCEKSQLEQACSACLFAEAAPFFMYQSYTVQWQSPPRAFNFSIQHHAATRPSHV